MIPRPQENSAPTVAVTDVTKRHHLIFAITTVLYWATLYIYVPILSPYLHDRGLSMGWIGFILGSYGLTQVITRLPLGIYSDRLSQRKPFLIAGMLAGLLSCVLFMLPGTWEGPLSGRLMAGICAAAWVPFSVLFASYYPADRTHQAMGTLSFLTVFGQLIGMSASGALAAWGGWNYAFICGIGIAAIGTLMAFFVYEPNITKPKTSDTAPTAKVNRNLVFRSAALWRVSILSLLAHGILFITMFGFTPLQATELGADKFQLTLIVISFMIPHALVSLWTGRKLAPRYGSRNIIIIGFIAAALFTAAIPYSTNLGWLALTQALNGVAQALYFPLLLSLAIRGFQSQQRATAMGLYQSVYSIGMFLGPYLAGSLNSFGSLRLGFLFGSALGIVAAAISWSKQLKD
ncbi:MAG: MFS transporter [Candidatus Cohnella colombiensis]|uniref:MFS transporter n=1 Tax=Candidatus Cohnella colombiensis TaxID=3121368 RepID=A0AA95JDA1_9BACL|nr:MAG: MFS transporter [Cohnella sp.]